MTKLPSTRLIYDNCYETTDGRFRIERHFTKVLLKTRFAMFPVNKPEWHLSDLWHQRVSGTFSTKREALEAIATIDLHGNLRGWDLPD